ncbi:MAG TPA: COX15/CtaA family protein [Candidatus Limnocylindrales bacterium]|nr:COX15/CtaA family protein [Candidatus Limnocylindrales bacterium]
MDAAPGRLTALLRITLVLVFVLIVWGGIVRLSGSGLAIPDWPLAHGKLVPRPHPHVLIEYVHRFLAMLVGFATLAVAITVFRSSAWRRRLQTLAVLALITLALQIFLGARVVLDELPVDRVVAHLVIAFFFFAVLLRMALIARDAEDPAGVSPGAAAGDAAAGRADPGARRGIALWARIATGAVLIQVALGGWVSSSGAALACPDFPTCQGMWLPPMNGLLGIHMAHRMGAYAVVVIVLGLLFRAAPLKLPPRARWPLRISGILLAAQFLLGVANVVLRVPLPVSAGHLATALMLFGTLTIASYELSRA